MNQTIAGAAIERLLGSGKAGPPSDPRPLTALEWGVYETLLASILDLLREAWAPLANLSFRVVRRESDPGALQLPRLEEMAVMVVLEAVVGDQRGSLDLVFPVYAVEPCLSRLQTVPAPAGKAGGEGEAGLSGRITPAEVAVSADLPTETARLEDMRDLKPGDLIVSSHPATAPVILSVEGCPKFQARLGRMKDRRAAKLETDVVPDDARQARASVIRAAAGTAGEAPAVDVLLAVPLGASVVLAEKRATLREVLATRPGELITFDRRADAPLELRVGGRRIAEGSAVRVGERFGLKISAIADPRDRVRALGT
ncbi:MAG TPA: FliM/FliN family flagellar motor switch protein [Planctomycetota bacterium]